MANKNVLIPFAKYELLKKNKSKTTEHPIKQPTPANKPLILSDTDAESQIDGVDLNKAPHLISQSGKGDGNESANSMDDDTPGDHRFVEKTRPMPIAAVSRTLPLEIRAQGERLMAFILKNGGTTLSWSRDGELIVNKRVIRQTHIVELLMDLLSGSEEPKPFGAHFFREGLQKIKTPLHLMLPRHFTTSDAQDEADDPTSDHSDGEEADSFAHETITQKRKKETEPPRIVKRKKGFKGAVDVQKGQGSPMFKEVKNWLKY